MVVLDEIERHPQSWKPTSNFDRAPKWVDPLSLPSSSSLARIGYPTPLPHRYFGYLLLILHLGSRFFRHSTAAASPEPTAQPKSSSSSIRTGGGRPSEDVAERGCCSTSSCSGTCTDSNSPDANSAPASSRSSRSRMLNQKSHGRMRGPS